MGAQREKHRIKSRIDELPEEVVELIDQRLADVNYTYQEIADEVTELGYEISKSSIGRYALRQNKVACRLKEAQEQTKTLINMIKKNPEIDYTEGALQIISGELTKKFAAAQEEWDNMPLDKAARVMVSLSRTKIYKEKIKADMQKKIDMAFIEFREKIPDAIRNDEELSKAMNELLEKAKARMLEDE